MSTLLILTVGTGTAGNTSNLTQGLVNTILKIQPRRFWLMPSSSPDSIAVADLIRSETEASFAPWSTEQPYRLIANPDQLEDCRRVVRELITRVRRELKPGERLLVNPTSGTKQMSAGATLAALDEQVGDILFTVGQRRDGVVITGTEQITTFDPATYFAERDLNLAREFFAAGSWKAAARVLEPHPEFQKQRATALCLGEWSRQNYAQAAGIAARFSEPLRAHLSALSQAVEAARLDPLVLADLLDAAAHALRLGDAEAALALGYKSLEYAARLRLFEQTQIAPPYRIKDFNELPIPRWLKDRYLTMANDGQLRPGMRQVIEILDACNDAFATDFLNNRALQRLLNLRNLLTHEIRPAAFDEADALIKEVRNLLGQHLTLPETPARPVAL